jgi:hypothetical protein
MKIALYQHHHELPFWHHSTQPYAMFDEKEMASFKTEYIQRDEPKIINMHESSTWPILIGLQNLEIQNVMAHVSYIFDLEKRTAKRTKRFWVQITTLPVEEEKNIPLIIKDGEVNVIHLWGGDNKTYHPTQLIKYAVGESDIWDPKFWTYFFEKMFNNERQSLEARIQKAKNEVEKLEEVLKFYPTLV